MQATSGVLQDEAELLRLRNSRQLINRVVNVKTTVTAYYEALMKLSRVDETCIKSSNSQSTETTPPYDITRDVIEIPWPMTIFCTWDFVLH